MQEIIYLSLSVCSHSANVDLKRFAFILQVKKIHPCVTSVQQVCNKTILTPLGFGRRFCLQVLGGKMKDEVRTGIIPCGDEVIMFYTEGYKFTFMRYVTGKSCDFVYLPVTDGYVLGVTHDNFQIAIYVGDLKPKIYEKYSVIAGGYLVSDSNVYNYEYKFDNIIFTGGTLNSLYSPHCLQYDRSDKVAKYNDDSLKCYGVLGDINSEISVYSDFLTRDRNVISNGTINLKIKLEKELMLTDIISYYIKIKNILSFMTFRGNVGFEKICLYHKIDDKHFGSFSLFVNNESIELTSKKHSHSLNFDDLNTKTSSLFELFFKKESKKPFYMLEFIPKDDATKSVITNDVIRQVCSSLECELRYFKSQDYDEDKRLALLIGEIKGVVNKHRKGENALEKKVYDRIYGSMKNWAVPLAVKVNRMYLYHKSVLSNIIGNIIVDDETGERLINEFIKYRNDITHVNNFCLNQEVADTAAIMECLVYCRILERIGFTNEEIAEFFKQRKICS